MKQMGRWSRSWLAAMIVMLVVLLTGCGNGSDHSFTVKPSSPSASGSSQTEQKQLPLTSFKDVSDYIRKHQELPANFITKKEAEQLGWVASKGNLDKVAPGKSIGGDRFGNREGLLPKAKNRIWYEADINYKKGPRGADRIIYSNDGLIYMTTDHYKSFTDITKEGSVPK
ncbi:ribonuclease domain-containing protein [Paenibacillus sp.]|uniref:ribonuclease domain-containing protein n=1 Tax=Paenibacillus sp. TaxID=58172 RepID=UPI0035CCDD54